MIWNLIPQQLFNLWNYQRKIKCPHDREIIQDCLLWNQGRNHDIISKLIKNL